MKTYEKLMKNLWKLMKLMKTYENLWKTYEKTEMNELWIKKLISPAPAARLKTYESVKSFLHLNLDRNFSRKISTNLNWKIVLYIKLYMIYIKHIIPVLTYCQSLDVSACSGNRVGSDRALTLEYRHYLAAGSSWKKGSCFLRINDWGHHRGSLPPRQTRTASVWCSLQIQIASEMKGTGWKKPGHLSHCCIRTLYCLWAVSILSRVMSW